MFKVFIKEMMFRCFLNKKSEYPPVCGVVFVYSGWLAGLFDSQVTKRGGPRGDSHRESSLSPISHLGVKYVYKAPLVGLTQCRTVRDYRECSPGHMMNAYRCLSSNVVINNLKRITALGRQDIREVLHKKTY
jgi:hypothetical protein